MDKQKRKTFVLLAFLIVALAFGAGVRYGQSILFKDDGQCLIAEMERRGFALTGADTGETGSADEEEAAEGEESEALAFGDTVNLNEADTYALQLLPGIGPKKAAAILAYREENGGFQTVEEIMEVPGIGDATFTEIAPYLVLE